jgi:hypothetical protein
VPPGGARVLPDPALKRRERAQRREERPAVDAPLLQAGHDLGAGHPEDVLVQDDGRRPVDVARPGALGVELQPGYRAQALAVPGVEETLAGHQLLDALAQGQVRRRRRARPLTALRQRRGGVPAVVGQRPHPVEQRLVAGDEHASLPGGQEVGAREAEGATVAQAAHLLAVDLGAEGRGRVLQHPEVVGAGELGDAHHVGRVAVQVDGHEGPGAAGEGPVRRVRVEAPGIRVDVHEHGRGADGGDGADRRHPGELRHDHLVARPHAQGAERQAQGARAIRRPQGEAGSQVTGQGLPQPAPAVVPVLVATVAGGVEEVSAFFPREGRPRRPDGPGLHCHRLPGFARPRRAGVLPHALAGAPRGTDSRQNLRGPCEYRKRRRRTFARSPGFAAGRRGRTRPGVEPAPPRSQRGR